MSFFYKSHVSWISDILTEHTTYHVLCVTNRQIQCNMKRERGRTCVCEREREIKRWREVEKQWEVSERAGILWERCHALRPDKQHFVIFDVQMRNSVALNCFVWNERKFRKMIPLSEASDLWKPTCILSFLWQLSCWLTFRIYRFVFPIAHFSLSFFFTFCFFFFAPLARHPRFT